MDNHRLEGENAIEPPSDWPGARQWLTSSFDRSLCFDPVVKGEPPTTEQELSSRRYWIKAAIFDLAVAPDEQAFSVTADRLVESLPLAFPGPPESPNGRFVSNAQNAALALKMTTPNASLSTWHPIPEDTAALSLSERTGLKTRAFSGMLQSAAQRLAHFRPAQMTEEDASDALDSLLMASHEAIKWTGKTLLRAASGLVALDSLASAQKLIADGQRDREARIDPEERLNSARMEICERFGYSGVEVENAHNLTLSAQYLLVSSMRDQLANAAKRLGVEDKMMGFEGAWHLRILDAPLNVCAYNRHAYVLAETGVFALPVDAGAVSFIEHEWTHALDARLWDKAKEAATLSGAGAAPFWNAPKHERFFSLLPAEAQDYLPLAKEGYLRAMGAGQNIDGAAGFEQLARQTREKSIAVGDRIIAQLLLPLSQTPNGSVESLDELSYERLRDSVSGAIKHLVASKEAEAHCIAGAMGCSPLESFAEALLRQPPESSLSVAADIITGAFTAQWGAEWRQSLPLPPPEQIAGDYSSTKEPARAQLAFALQTAIENNALAISEVGFSKTPFEGLANPQSAFTRASRWLSVASSKIDYWDAPHEMLARTLSRPDRLRDRLEGVSRSEAITPQMNFQQQEWLKEGWAKMTEAAGLAPAIKQRSYRDRLEGALLAAEQTLEPSIAVASQTYQSAKKLYGHLSDRVDQVDEALTAKLRTAFAKPIAPQPPLDGLQPPDMRPPQTAAVDSATAPAILSNLAARRAAKANSQPAPAHPSPKA